ncbi:MAG TPA: tetratricopeptide repeat protein [Actinomycetota bacterium]|jgi:tetratricopeptide (TPR) repeat protein|nr:tetratricopeptide repeat protein [Actinomycetota bacterium]
MVPKDRKAEPKGRKAEPNLPRAVVEELASTARPGKEAPLLEVFERAAEAFASGDYGEASRLGEQAKQMALRAASVRELLGLSYYHLERYKDAARELSAFRRITASAEQNHVIADCYRAAGRPDRALELVAEMSPSEVGPDVYAEGVIVAAGALADMGKIDEAIARLEREDLRPPTARERHIRMWYMMGDLLERKGKFTQARSYFEAVLAADPGLTDAGDRLRRLGGR